MGTWRLEVELRSPQVLIDAMAYREDTTVRQLAAAVERRLAKSGIRQGGSRSEIGHLRSGARKRVKPEVAKAIAAELGVPVGLLFTPSVSNGSQVIRQGSAA